MDSEDSSETEYAPDRDEIDARKYLEINEKVAEFGRKHHSTWLILNRLTHANNGKIVVIAKNPCLFMQIYTSRATIRFDLPSAIFTLKSGLSGSILIHFPEIETYGVFTPTQYANFAEDARGGPEDKFLHPHGKPEPKPIDIYQVVIASTTQKLAVACSSLAHHAGLIECITKCFPGVSVTKSSNQFIVDVRANSENELVELWERLYMTTGDHDMDVRKHLQQIVPLDCEGVKYRKVHAMYTLMVEKTISKLIESLPAPITVNIHGDHNTVGAIGIDNTGNAVAEGSQLEILKQQVAAPARELSLGEVAKLWAEENRPNEGEMISNYLARYNLENPDHQLSAPAFGRSVKTTLAELGYATVKRSINKKQERVWETQRLKEIK